METTLEQLQSLAKDPRILSLPADLGKQDGQPWWKQVDEISRLATEMDIWFVAQFAALAFRTYPGIIHDISVGWSDVVEGGEIYCDRSLRINEVSFDPDGCDLPEDLSENISDIDDHIVLDALYRTVENSMGPIQREHLDRVNKIFLGDVSSAEASIAIADGIEPSILSVLQQKLLDTQVVKPSRIRPKGRI